MDSKKTRSDSHLVAGNAQEWGEDTAHQDVIQYLIHGNLEEGGSGQPQGSFLAHDDPTTAMQGTSRTDVNTKQHTRVNEIGNKSQWMLGAEDSILVPLPKLDPLAILDLVNSAAKIPVCL